MASGGRGAGARGRREPSFAGARGFADMRVMPEDRPAPPRKPGGGQARSTTDRSSRQRSGNGGGGSRKRPKERRSLLGRLLVWGVTASLWGLILLTVVVGYYFTKLPPIDQ